MGCKEKSGTNWLETEFKYCYGSLPGDQMARYPKTEIENCFPGKSPFPCACLRVAASAKAGEGARGRGNLKGELFTLIPAYRQAG